MNKIVMYLLWCLLQTGVQSRINLALNKTVYSSDPYYANKENRLVVDGVIGMGDDSCFSGRYGWIAVDLGKMLRIKTVIVHGRVDKYGSYLKNTLTRLSPTFSKSAISSYEECNSYNGDVQDGQKMVFICKDQFKENKFVIVAFQHQFFCICEIEVYERELDDFGCFEDAIALNIRYNSNFSACMKTCNHTMATFAAIKDGKVCVCSNYVRKKTSSKWCSVPCDDSPLHGCGGPSLYSVYTVCERGYYGKYCNETCHCKDRSPCDRAGKCYDECQPGWTGDHCSQIKESQEFFFESCLETTNMFKTDYISTNSICSEHCNKYDFRYFGIKNSKCYCFEELNHRRNSGCYYDLHVHHVCSLGSYGDFCLETCHCSSRYCSKTDGMCLKGSECLPGWKGTSCNIRDCNENKGGCNPFSECQNDDIPFCSCKHGFSDLSSCEDEDECSTVELICGNNSACHNVPGSYKCICLDGYSSEGSESCEDIDECINGACDALSTECQNTIGSYYCKCRNGFVSTLINFSSCNDTDECAIDNGGCNSIVTNCSNTFGSFECICLEDGLVYNYTSKFCQQLTLESAELKRSWHIPLVISFLVLAVVAFVLLAVICGRRHMNRLRKAFSILSSSNKDCHTVISDEPNSKVFLEELEGYLKNDVKTIQEQFTNEPKQTNKECKYGSKTELKPKNRFKNVIPYDFNRVVLKISDSAEDHSNYVNASLIVESFVRYEVPVNANYIAAQGPTENSLEDFWFMVLQENVDTIIMLTLVFEEGKNKCYQYWPENQESPVDCGQFLVNLESEEKWPHFISRRLSVLNVDKLVLCDEYIF